ncbi:hypothetical protein WDZ92_36015, partial [Nostoc sp. NIES-2111]
ALCLALGIPFDEAMLAWPAGPRASDGVWAPAWVAPGRRPPAGRLTVAAAPDDEGVGSRLSDVAGLAATSAGTAILTGSEDVRIDAKRITMG